MSCRWANLTPASTVTVKSPTACSITRFRRSVLTTISSDLPTPPQPSLLLLPQGKTRQLLLYAQLMTLLSSSLVLGYTMLLGKFLGAFTLVIRFCHTGFKFSQL